tara:strand:+ start:16 stop:549 length:534 start_codon:yes stop_codon:yes gene_type:complete
MKNFLPILFLLTAFASCKKEDKIEPDNTSNTEETDATVENEVEPTTTTEEEKDNIEENTLKEDIIKIVTATSSSNLIDGDKVDFTVTLNYDLTSLEKGEIGIGFNNGPNSKSASMLPVDKYIENGSSKHTFIVTATVKDWGTESDFVVYVNMSEADPTPGEPYYPVASDRFILIPKD